MKQIVATLLCLGMVAVAGAQVGFDWDSDPTSTMITDFTGDANHASRDILKLWYGFDALNHYFRMDINAAPIQASGEFAEEYQIMIDTPTVLGGTQSDSDYIAANLGNIDKIVDLHYTLFDSFIPVGGHVHEWDDASPFKFDSPSLVGEGAAYQTDENGGMTLEWCVPKAALGLPVGTLIYGATMDISDPETYDVTNSIAVPEPATMAVLGLGALCLRRRRA